MPVMELYRPLPEHESSTEGMVGTAAAPGVSKGWRAGQIRNIIKTRKTQTQSLLLLFSIENFVVKILQSFEDVEAAIKVQTIKWKN